MRILLATMDHDQAMEAALSEAIAALEHDDVPVGAVVVIDGEIVAERHNEREAQSDPTAHAEILVLREAARKVGSWNLSGATLVVTLEPCAMCAGAIVNSRISTLVFGATDPKAGAVESLYSICTDSRLNHRVNVISGVESERCAALLHEFFTAKRKPR